MGPPELIVLFIIAAIVLLIVMAVRGYRRRTDALKQIGSDEYRPPRQKLP